MRPCTLVILALLTPPAGAATLQAGPRVELIDTAVIATSRLGESSGVAPSHQLGVFWTINDSGNEPLLLAIDTLGRDRGFVRVSGASNVDWEDLAAGPCLIRPAPCLYIADIGDNRRRRSEVRVYRVIEPQPTSDSTDTSRVVSVLDTIVLRYPDGPHDAEALAVSPDGMALIITKERAGPPQVFAAGLASGGPSELRRAGALEMRGGALVGREVTGAALSRDGRLLVVRTYVSLHLFRVSPDGLAPLLDPEGLPIPVVESQGEAVTFAAPNELLLTSERGARGHAILSRLRLILP